MKFGSWTTEKDRRLYISPLSVAIAASEVDVAEALVTMESETSWVDLSDH